MMKSEDFSGEGGKEHFIKQVFDEYYRRLCFYASRYLSDPDETKDVVQEVLLTLWERNPEFQNQTALNAFLYSSVYHACINRLKLSNIHHRHHQRILEQSNLVDQTNYVTDRIESEVMWEIFTAIDSLPVECQKIFKLSYLEGYDLQKVAGELNISIHTVKSQRARAKKILQERLRDLFPVLAMLFLN